MPQSEDVDWNFPVLVEDVVMMGRYGHMNFLRMPSRADRDKVDQALERVGMSAYRDRQIGELSGGQKKRVFLARSLAQEGRIILLDEPFTGVDVKTEERDHRPAARTARRRPPDAGLDPQSRQRAGFLRPGRADQPHACSAAGPTAEVFTQANLERAFGGVLRHFQLGGTRAARRRRRRSVTVLTDDERPLVFYGDKADGPPTSKPARDRA